MTAALTIFINIEVFLCLQVIVHTAELTNYIARSVDRRGLAEPSVTLLKVRSL